MAESVFNMKVALDPEFNMKKLDSQLDALQKRLRSAKSGSYSRESNLLADMINSLVTQGRASSVIQGRRLLEKRMGGRFGSFGSGILLEAQEKARTGFRDTPFSQKQIPRQPVLL